jgi:hypothetical protein
MPLQKKNNRANRVDLEKKVQLKEKVFVGPNPTLSI